VPMVTTDCGIHSPEISYLRTGENGVMAQNSVEDFSSVVIALLNDGAERRRLGVNSRAAAMHYTLENMAKRFRVGILNRRRPGSDVPPLRRAYAPARGRTLLTSWRAPSSMKIVFVTR
jgi:hypothetical protein